MAVQGDLLVDDGKLYLAGGSVLSPAAFDLASGEFTAAGQRGRRGRELQLVSAQNNRGETERRVVALGQPLYATAREPGVRARQATGMGRRRGHCQERTRCSCRAERDGWKLVARSAADEQALWEQPLPGEAVRWGIAVDARGRIVVTLRDGRVLCFGGK